MPTPRISIVIPAYRSTRLRECLDALAETRCSTPAETIVVLNGASPEVARIARGHDAVTQVVQVPVNLGVSGAFNHGFALAKGDLLVQLQDDAIVHPDWLTPLVECADSAPDIGAVGGLILSPDGVVVDAGAVVWRDGSTTPGLVDGSRDAGAYTAARAIDYHGSAGMLLRREAWEGVAGFDDDYYPAYYGDVDMCFRLRERGWRVMVDPRAHVVHSAGASTAAPFRTFLGYRHRARFVERHHTALDGHGLPRTDPAGVTAEMARAAAWPAGPAPTAVTPDERRRLGDRLQWDGLEVAARERDVWIAFAATLAEQSDAAADAAGARITSLAGALHDEQRNSAHLVRRLTAALAQLDDVQADREAAHLALQQARADIDRITRSRSWRYTRPLRRD